MNEGYFRHTPLDDCRLYGDEAVMLVPPQDFTIMVVDSTEGLALVLRHLKELDENDEVTPPTRGI